MAARAAGPSKSIPALADGFIAQFDARTAKHLVPHLPADLRAVPRANIQFLPIKDAWFSGSMNYLGHARKPDGSPEYEATYEINASLEISVPEFMQLVSHEVVPGHVTTSALIQNLYVRGRMGFEATVLTMNTRAATLFEGIANNAILIAYGVTEVEELPDEDLQIGVLLALLQDDAKNQSSYLTWKEGVPQKDVAATLRRDFLVSEERADKLSGAWGRHPLLGPHVPARLPRRHGGRRGAAAQAPAREGPSGPLRLLGPGRRRDRAPGARGGVVRGRGKKVARGPLEADYAPWRGFRSTRRSWGSRRAFTGCGRCRGRVPGPALARRARRRLRGPRHEPALRPA